MKPSLLNTDMDFRVIPSAIPLQSPSPDKKNANNITPTISPNPIQIKKNITPHKKTRVQKENAKFYADRSTDMKYATHSPGADYSSALKEKEQVIRNLKHIIDLITENGRKNVYGEAEQNDLKKQNKILTIQNQKLVNIIERLKNKEHRPEQTIKVQQRYEKQIGELMETMKISKEEHEDEQRQLKRLYKALNIHCKNIENEKKQLENENQKLLKILRDKNEADKKFSEKSRISESSEGQSEKSHKNEKLSLAKIKEQYAENMKMLRDGLIKEIQETFDTMRIALEGMGSKATHLGIRVDSIQKIIRQKLSNPKCGADLSEEQKLLGTNRKSEIYIEEGPDSSHPSHQTSKDQVVDSRSSSNQLRSQLAKTKAELEELRFKYDKICLDNSTVSYSKRIQLDQQGYGEQYEKIMFEVEKKDKQIEILYGQIKNIEQQNLQASRQRYAEWQEMMENKERVIAELKEQHLVEIQEMKGETQLKVKLLVENYQKQIELLKKQIVLKNTDLHEANQVGQIHRSESQKKMEDLEKIIYSLKQHIEETNQKLQLYEGKIRQYELEASMNQESWEREKQILQQKYQGLENISKTDRTKRQQVEQEVIMQMVELSQYKREAEESKLLADKRCHQLETEFGEKIQSLEEAIKNEREEKETLINEIQSKKTLISEMKELLSQYQKDDILQQINELQKLAESQRDKSRIQISYSFEKNEEDSEMNRLTEELNELKQNLQEKEQKCIQQQARIIELEGLCELNRTKFEEQQALHLELLSRYKQIESQSNILSSKLKESSFDEVLGKISQLRQLEMERRQKTQDLLQK